MDADTIAGCRAKADRAEASVEELASDWKAWVATNPYPSRIDVEPDRSEHRLYYDFSTPIPLRFPVRVGEIAHDLRSALDHLVWREAVELIGYKAADKKGSRLAFPILRSRVAFRKSEVKGWVNPDAWTIIERYQPYDRGKPKRSKDLSLLHWINRVDKHRLLHGGTVHLGHFNPVTLVSFDPSARLIEAPVWGNVLGRPLKRETKIAWFRFDPQGSDPDMRVEGTPKMNVSFGDTPGYLRRAEISETIRETRRVIDDFARLMS